MTLIDKAEALAPCPFCGGGVSVTITERVGGIVCDAPSECIGSGLLIVFDLEDMETAIAAWNRRAALPARGVRKLEWTGPRKLDEGGVAYDAHTACGQYIATDSGWFLVGRSGWIVATSLDAAKAAAQADYEARILAALEPALAPTDAAQAPTDTRPANCRFRLKDEGKPYGRSSCSACGKSVFTGLGKSCTEGTTDAAQARETALRFLASFVSGMDEATFFSFASDMDRAFETHRATEASDRILALLSEARA